jgi:hypothetical protein
MKRLFFLFLLTSQGAFAATMVAECLGEDFRIRTLVDLDGKTPHYVEVYTQGGLGPNNLEESYVAKKSRFKTDVDSIRIEADLPMNGRIFINNKDGSIRFPGSDNVVHELKDCKYSFN